MISQINKNWKSMKFKTGWPIYFPLKLDDKVLLLIQTQQNLTRYQDKNGNILKGSKIKQKLHLHGSDILILWHKTNKAWWYCKLLLGWPGLVVKMLQAQKIIHNPRVIIWWRLCWWHCIAVVCVCTYGVYIYIYIYDV